MEPMLLTSNCNQLFIQSGMLEEWWRGIIYDLSINITHNGCTQYGITLPPRYRFVVTDFNCEVGTASVTIGIQEYDDAVLSVAVSSTSPQVTSTSVNGNVISFTYTSNPVVIVLDVEVNGYEYQVTIEQQLGDPDVCEDGVEIDSDNTVYPELPCGTSFDFPSSTLTVNYMALVGDCDMDEDDDVIPYGLYKVDINDSQVACLYVDCEDLLKCKVSSYMAGCPTSEAGYYYHTFNTLLLDSYGGVPTCTDCSKVEEMYKELLHIICIPCPEKKKPCKC